MRIGNHLIFHLNKIPLQVGIIFSGDHFPIEIEDGLGIHSISECESLYPEGHVNSHFFPTLVRFVKQFGEFFKVVMFSPLLIVGHLLTKNSKMKISNQYEF